jgi:hypothetical protein
MEGNKFLKEYTLSDLFDGTFKMLKFTWKNTLIIAGICFVPMALGVVFLMTRYFNSLYNIIESGFSVDSMNIMSLWNSFSGLIGFGLLIVIISFLITLFVKACVALNTFKVAQGESITLEDLIMTVLKEKLGKLVLQTLLYAGIILAVIIGAGIALGIVGVVFTLINRGLGIFMIVMGVFAFYGLLIWLMNSFSFVNEEVIYADTPVAASFKKSFNLVKGNWWRVFGILLVFNLALSFSVSLISSPITFSMMASFYSEMFEKLLNGGSVTDLYQSIFTMYSHAYIPLVLSTVLSTILSYLVSPVFKSLFYLDLKIKKKEIIFEQELPPDETGGAETGEKTQEMLDSDQE